MSSRDANKKGAGCASPSGPLTTSTGLPRGYGFLDRRCGELDRRPFWYVDLKVAQRRASADSLPLVVSADLRTMSYYGLVTLGKSSLVLGGPFTRFSHDRDYSLASLRLAHCRSSRGANVLDREPGSLVGHSVLYEPIYFPISGWGQGSGVGCGVG